MEEDGGSGRARSLSRRVVEAVVGQAGAAVHLALLDNAAGRR